MPQIPSASSAQLFAELVVQLHNAPGLEETVETVAQFALRAAGCTSAGVILAGPVVGAVTDPVVQKLFEREVDAGAGPTLDALAGGHTVYLPDTGAATDWPRWRTEAVSCDVGSALYVPMVARSRIEGVLSLYHLETEAFSDADAEPIAHILARHASIAVAGNLRTESLDRAVDARKLVGLAMGILMERFTIDGDQAFALLRRYSQQSGTKLRDVAQQVIDTRGSMSPSVQAMSDKDDAGE